MRHLDRRTFISGAAAVSAASILPQRAFGQGGPLNVFAHRVMQTVSTGAQGGDITKPWTAQTGLAVQWTTFDTGPLQERLFREASLNETTVDVGFVLNTQATPRVSQLFEPLDEYMKKDPIEAPEDVFPGLIEGMKVGGKLIAVPFRHASSGLHYNEQLLSEKGFKKPPETIEELVTIAKACSGPRDGGPPVVGLITPGVTYPNVIDIARAWDGEFITPNFKYEGDKEPMLKAVHLLRDLFEAKAFPRNFATLSTEDVNVWMQQGRAALSLQSMGRNRIYNDPQKSQFSGKIKTVAVPISESLKSKYAVAPAKVEFWGLAIPKNAKRKDLSWSFIKAMVTKQATLGAALNGNGPVRNSTYDDAGFRTQVPYADEERRVLKVARVPLPAFDEAARAGDFFKEEVEAAVLGLKKVEEAMASLGQRVKPLLPA